MRTIPASWPFQLRGARIVRLRLLRSSAGSVVVEAALMMVVTCMVGLAVIEMARTAWTAHAAVYASEVAARRLALCGDSAASVSAIAAQIRPILESTGQLKPDTALSWLQARGIPSGCNAETCTHGSVVLSGLVVRVGLPRAALSIDVSPPRLTVGRETWGQSASNEPSCSS